MVEFGKRALNPFEYLLNLVSGPENTNTHGILNAPRRLCVGNTTDSKNHRDRNKVSKMSPILRNSTSDLQEPTKQTINK